MSLRAERSSLPVFLRKRPFGDCLGLALPETGFVAMTKVDVFLGWQSSYRKTEKFPRNHV
jgi:hypothetical protein